MNRDPIITISDNHILLHLNKISLSEIIRRLGELPDFCLIKKRQSILNDEAYAIFSCSGHTFEITTPISDYMIERPHACPINTFALILNQFRQTKQQTEEAEQVGAGDAEEAV